MKKILFITFIAISLLSSTNTLKAQCGTNLVGTSNYIQYSALSDMAIAPDNKIYTFAYNTNASQYQLHEAYSAGSWSLVATLSGYTTIKPDINVSKTGKVSVFFRDDLDGGRGKVYTLSGATFTAIGAAISTSSVSNLSLAFDLAGKECIAYTDITNSNKSTVKQWNGTSSWDNVGSGTVSPGAGYFNSLIVDKNDKLVLAFQDGNSGNKTNVYKYTAGAWGSIGIVGSTANNCKLKEASNGDYYLGYTETTNNAVVHKYNGTVWAQLGTAIGSISSAANNFDLELDAVDVPYLLTAATSTPNIVIYRYLSSTWNLLTQFSNTSSNILALSIDNIGTPFMFHVDVPFNNGLNVKRLFNPVSISTQPVSMTVCDGQTAFFNVAAVGGTPTYQWQQSAFGDFSNLAGATGSNYTTPPANIGMNQYKYRCVVGTGCSNIISNSGTLTVSSLNAATTATNPTCFNSNNGTITSTVTGGFGPYTYSWSPVGGTAATASSLNWNTYTLNVNDQIGCTTSTIVTLTSPPSISSSFSGNMMICNGSSTTLTVTSTGGTGAFTYSWSPGASLSATTGSIVTANPSSMQTYNVQVTDAMGCVATTTVMVDMYANQPTITGNASLGTICNGTNVTLSSSGINVNTYVWNPGGLSGPSQNVTPSSSTVYTVTGTNTVTGCSASTTVAVTVNPLPTVSAGPTRTLTCANTSTTLAGSTTGGISYNWTGPGIVSGGTTLNPTINAPGTYDLSVVSAFGCSAGPSPVSITQNITPPSPTASTSGTLTCSTLTVALNGAPGTGVTYQWTGPGFSGGTTSQNAIANAAGSFTLKVTSSINGCTNTAVTNVTQNVTAPNPFANSSGSITCATTTVALTALPASGVSYSWSGPGTIFSPTSQTTAVNAGGNYTLAITSLTNGCSNIFPITINTNTVSPTVIPTMSGSLTCVTNTITAYVTTTTTPVTYNWTGTGILTGAATPTITTNTTGIKNYLVTNTSNGCSTYSNVVVVQNTVAPNGTWGSTAINCTSPTSSLYVSTLASPVSYNWTGPGIISATNIATITANQGGTYTYSVTNTTNGCVFSNTVGVSQNTVAPSVTSSASNTITCTTPTANAIASTVASPVTYTWTGTGIVSGAPTASLVVNTGGIKSYTVTNTTNGCSTSGTVNVTQNLTAPTITASATPSIICAGNFSTLQANGANTYTWTPGNLLGASQGVNPLTTTTYTVVGTNTLTGCTSSSVVILPVNPLPSAITGGNKTLTCVNTSTTITVGGSGGTPPYTYMWNGPGIISGANGPIATVNAPGIYSVSISDTKGCYPITPSTVSVIQNTVIPTANAGLDQFLTCSTLSVNLIGSAIPSSCTPVWTGPVSSGSNSYNATTSTLGGYTLTVTDPINGCSATDFVQVTSNTPTPSINVTLSNTLTCANITSTISTTTSASSPIFSWTGPGIISGNTTSNPIVNQPGIYTVTVVENVTGCVNTETVSVVSDITTPSVILSSNTATLTCANPTVAISSTVSPVTTIYSWIPTSGIVTGTETTGNPTFNAAGSYTATITNTVNGCTTTTTVDVFQNTTIPTLTIVATPSVICSGNSSTLTANGAVTYTWSTAQTTASITVTPTITGTYTVYGTGTNGCVGSYIETITVNTAPNLSITGNTNICKGSSTTLTGSGATSYTWNSGINTSTINITPTITTTYTLNGDNGNGCISSLPVTVSIIPNKTISGIITSTTGATNGDVILYKYTPALSHWDSVTTVPFASSYSFANIDSALYVVRAIPTATNIQVTYGDSAISWQDATIINHGCANNSTQNIKLIALENFVIGPGVLTGTITEGDGFVPRMNNEFKPLAPGGPIGGIVVKGGRNPGGQMFLQTTTDAAGQYTLSGLPVNTGTESYFVFVDIPGLDTNGTHHVVITSSDTVYTGLNFNVDSMYINPTVVTRLPNENSILNNSIYLFPNPAKDIVNIKYELNQPAKVSIELYNIIGEKLEDVSPYTIQDKNQYQHTINLVYLKSGLYLVKIRVNSSEKIIKLVKTE